MSLTSWAIKPEELPDILVSSFQSQVTGFKFSIIFNASSYSICLILVLYFISEVCNNLVHETVPSIIASPRDEKSLSVITFSMKYSSPTTRWQYQTP